MASRILTSNFHASGEDPNAIAISRGLPRWKPFRGPQCLDLAPSYAMLKLPRAEYERHFTAMLEKLDPNKVYADLIALVPGDPILLCHEPIGLFCHRRMVAEWLEQHLRVVIPEVGQDRADTLPYAEMPDKPAKVKKATRQLPLLALFGGAVWALWHHH